MNTVVPIPIPEIKSSWTLGQLRDAFPGVELVLFSNFGIGSRERSGFSAQESLEDLLRRHLVFDFQRACEQLNALAQEDSAHALSPEECRSLLGRGEAKILDVRSEEEFSRAHINGAKHLNQASVAEAKASTGKTYVCVCQDGRQSPSAARLLRSMGLEARHLHQGLHSWSLRVDRAFPIQYPLQEEPGHWYLLADGETLRYWYPQPTPANEFKVLSSTDLRSFSRGQRLLKNCPNLSLVVSTPNGIAFRGLPRDLTQSIGIMPEEWLQSSVWQEHGRVSDEVQERRKLEETLAIESKAILQSHKGTVEVAGYEGRVLTLKLGGGCAGCASAQITAKRELAASLYRAVPCLQRIVAEA